MQYKGFVFVNVTPHPIKFRSSDGSEFEVLPSGYLVNARAVEEIISNLLGIEFVSTKFQGDIEGTKIIQKIHESLPDKNILIIGSIIAAQAYPGQVVAMTPAPGFERVPIAEKIMNPDKFTVY